MEFEKVWEDIINKVRDNNVIYTLRYNKQNTIEEIKENGLMVATTGTPKLVKKEWIEAVWNTLNEKREITADDIPGTARYRSSFIMALLAQLDYIKFEKEPMADYHQAIELKSRRRMKFLMNTNSGYIIQEVDKC